MAEIQPIEVVVKPDGLAASLRAPAGRDRALVSPELCDALLREAGVREGAIDWDEVAAFVDACRAADSGDCVERVVARGTPPQHGRQGVVEILEKFTPASEDPEQPAAEGERVDYRARSRFVPVLAGERIGRVADPTPGEDGESVRGTPIAAKHGPPPALRVHESIERRGDELFARKNGALQVGETLVRVVEAVEIDGFVDYTTGNIDLPCDLVVHKGVRDDFVVSVKGGATVQGLVEAATIVTGLDAALQGGMAARGKGELRVGRDLIAKYLDQVAGRVLRDARVSNEVVNCRLSIGRSLFAPTGQIIGGSVAVAGACEIDTVGSEASVPTELIIGRAPEVEDLLTRASEIKERVDARRQKTQREQTQLKTLSGPKLTASQAERSTELQYELSILDGCATRLDAACNGLRSAVQPHATGRLTVHGRIYAGVTLRVGAFIARFRRELRGPVLISLNDHGAPIVTNLLDDSVKRLKEIVPVEEEEGVITIRDPAA